MRSVLFWILSTVLLSAPALGQITEKTNTVTGSERLVSDDMRPLISETYPGHATFRAEYQRSVEERPGWRLSFFGIADEQTELSAATQVQVQADGQPIPPVHVESKTRQMGEESIMEMKHVTFSRSDYEQIATAESVMASIGPYQFEFTYPLREDLRLILDRVPPSEDRPTASSDDSGSR